MGAKLLMGHFECETKLSSENFWYELCEKCMVSFATHSGFENGGMSTKLLIAQLLLILDY